MKFPLLILGATAVSCLAEKLEIKDRITPEELAARRQESPMDRLPVIDVTDSKKVARPTESSILKESQILHDGTHWTLVPKGSVLFIPGSMASRVGVKPVGTLMPWAEFVQMNRAWLVAHEVSFDQASGKLPLPEASQAYWPKQGKVVIAVHQGGPISVKAVPETAKVNQP